MIRVIITRRRGIKIPHPFSALFTLLAALPWGSHRAFWTRRWLFSGWGWTIPMGGQVSPWAMFFCLGLVLAFSHVSLEKTGFHHPRAIESFNLLLKQFLNHSKSLRKAVASHHFARALFLPSLHSSLCIWPLIMNEPHAVELSDMIFIVCLSLRPSVQD